MSAILFMQLLVCAALTALNLFALETNASISYDTMVSTYIISCVIAVNFIFCHLSSQATTYLLGVNDIFYDCDWFMLPVEQQKLFILPMQRSQRGFHFNGLGLVDCTSMTFLSVGLRDYFCYVLWNCLCHIFFRR